MNAIPLLQQGMLFVHVVAFAVALSAVLREDMAILRARHIDTRRLVETATTLSGALLALWISGVALVLFDTGLHVQALLAKPKLTAKLLVVTALTANGLALHALALPLLRSPMPYQRRPSVLPLILGAISTVSWLYASFIGVSRLIAPWMSLAGFMSLYAALLALAIVVALVIVRPRLTSPPASTGTPAGFRASAARDSRTLAKLNGAYVREAGLRRH